jgi:hypothetical protein
MTDSELSALAPTFAALARALRDAAVPEAVRRRAFDAVMALSADVLTAAFPIRYAAMTDLVAEHPQLQPVLMPHLSRLAHLLH